MRQAVRLTLFCLALSCLCVPLAQAEGLFPRTTATRYGLERAWFAQVGSAQVNGPLQYVNYDEGMVLLQSSRGMLTALDAETGRTLWSTQIGSREGGSSEPAANDKHVVVLNGSTLFVVDRKDGGIVWQKQVRGAPGAGPGVTATHAFVPMASGIVEGYDLAAGTKQTPWNYQSTGRVLVPPMTTVSTVSWTTDKGHFYVADPKAGGIKYRLESRGAMHARPASWSPMLFSTSVDGFVYAIEENKGAIKWKYSVGHPIYTQPVAIENRVFVIPEFGDLYCLDSKTGDLVWHAPGIKQFVSASPTRVYAADELGRIAMLDLETGARVGTLPVSGLTKKLVNTSSDRIFLVDGSNVVQCLHETQLNAPALHTPPKPVAEEDLRLKPKKLGTAAPEEPAEATPAAETPADAATDPPADDGGSPFDAPTDASDAPAADAGGNPFDTP
jgi:outer membrane protein assembly factor BamB